MRQPGGVKNVLLISIVLALQIWQELSPRRQRLHVNVLMGPHLRCRLSTSWTALVLRVIFSKHSLQRIVWHAALGIIAPKTCLAGFALPLQALFRHFPPRSRTVSAQQKTLNYQGPTSRSKRVCVVRDGSKKGACSEFPGRREREWYQEKRDRFSIISLICGDLLAATAARNAYDVMDFQETAPILQELPSATVAQDFSSTLEWI